MDLAVLDDEDPTVEYRMRHGVILMEITKNAVTKARISVRDVDMGSATNTILQRAVDKWCNLHVCLEGIALSDFVPGHLGHNTNGIAVADSGALSTINCMFPDTATGMPLKNDLLAIQWPQVMVGDGKSAFDEREGGSFGGGYVDRDAIMERALFGRPTLKRAIRSTALTRGLLDGTFATSSRVLSLRSIFGGLSGAEPLIELWQYMHAYFGEFQIREETPFIVDAGGAIVAGDPVYRITMYTRGRNVNDETQLFFPNGRDVIPATGTYMLAAGYPFLPVKPRIEIGPPPARIVSEYATADELHMPLRDVWPERFADAHEWGTPWGTEDRWLKDAQELLNAYKLAPDFAAVGVLTIPTIYTRAIGFAASRDLPAFSASFTFDSAGDGADEML